MEVDSVNDRVYRKTLRFEFSFGKSRVFDSRVCMFGSEEISFDLTALVFFEMDNSYAIRVLRRFGFRKTLIVNAVTAGGFAAMCALFTPDTPYWVMLAVLLVGGFFRSLQLTAVNTLAYADVPHEMMSRASGFAAMAQQVGISLGVGLAAVTLNISMMLRGSNELAIPDVAAGFIVIGLFMALSGFGFARLPPYAGAEVSGRRAPATG